LKLKLPLISLFVVFFIISEFGGSFASANWISPIYNNIEISPQSVGATPPTIAFLSPENDKTYGSNLTLHCNISLGAVTRENVSCSIENLYYQADWENQPTKVIRLELNKDGTDWDTVVTGTVNSDFTEYSNNLTVPTEGKHSITIWAAEKGSYQVDMGKQFPSERINVYTFNINSSQTVAFTVSNSPPVKQLTPTQNANATGSDYFLNQTNLPLIVIVIAIVVVASISLVYFKRRKAKDPFSRRM
jgi:hypothetical protein